MRMMASTFRNGLVVVNCAVAADDSPSKEKDVDEEFCRFLSRSKLIPPSSPP